MDSFQVGRPPTRPEARGRAARRWRPVGPVVGVVSDYEPEAEEKRSSGQRTVLKLAWSGET